MKGEQNIMSGLSKPGQFCNSDGAVQQGLMPNGKQH